MDDWVIAKAEEDHQYKMADCIMQLNNYPDQHKIHQFLRTSIPIKKLTRLRNKMMIENGLCLYFTLDIRRPTPGRIAHISLIDTIYHKISEDVANKYKTQYWAIVDKYLMSQKHKMIQ